MVCVVKGFNLEVMKYLPLRISYSYDLAVYQPNNKASLWFLL